MTMTFRTFTITGTNPTKNKRNEKCFRQKPEAFFHFFTISNVDKIESSSAFVASVS